MTKTKSFSRQKIVIILYLMLTTQLIIDAEAQTNKYNFGQTNVNISLTEPTSLIGRTLLTDTYMREADVKYKKRIHRIIDTRIKQNRVLNWEKSSLRQYLYDNVTNKTITAFQTDNLKDIKTWDEIIQIGRDSSTFQIHDWRFPNDIYRMKDTTVVEEFKIKKIEKFRIMEDWYFDYKASEYKQKIIAIAPIYKQTIDKASIEYPMFWIKMDDIRPHLNRRVLYNEHNQASLLTQDDFFMSRMFDSYIIHEPNVNDIDINYYPSNINDGLAALLKSEEVKNDLFIFEHDLWEF